MHARSLLAGAVLCTSVTRAGLGQERTLRTVPPKTELRLLLVDSSIVAGRLTALEQTTIRLNMVVRPTLTESRLVARTLALDSVAAAWARAGTRWKVGAGAGAVLGMASMLVATAAAVEPADGPRCTVWCWTSAAVGGGVAGALLGALVGHQFVVWKPLRF